MTLDDIEKLAKEAASDDSPRIRAAIGTEASREVMLAIALKAMLPVVRAAIRLHEDTRCAVLQQMMSHRHLLTTGADLTAAIDALRSALEKS